MKRPLCPFAILAAGFLCMIPYCSATAGQPYANPAPPHSDRATPAPTSDDDSTTVEVPGPLRSFLRMAGISQEISPDEVLPLLSRNVMMQGYQENHETEFLLLVRRYISYGRELQSLAGPDGVLRISGCAQAQNLVHVLGYRIERQCGDPQAYLATASPERAFLTLDSGFPLTPLEQAIQKNAPFAYSFPSSRIPVIFRQRDWVSISNWRRQPGDNLVDVLLHDRSLARLYWAVSKLDGETQIALRGTPSLKALLPLAPALDFYGGQLSIRSGRVVLPGGPDADKAWEQLVGANPASPGPFVKKLLGDDRGWLAAWFDAVSHASLAEQKHLIAGDRFKFVYNVYKSSAAKSFATLGVFPSHGDLIVLLSRLRWQPNGDVYVPGDLKLWREILLQKTDSKLVRDWVRRAKTWDSADQLLGTLIALSHFESDSGPLQVYLLLNEIDRRRPDSGQLSEPTLRLISTHFAELHAWFPVFAEFPALNDASITQFINTAEALTAIDDPTLRSNALGAFQANIGIWEILARQQQIPPATLNTAWVQAIQPFTDASSPTKLFDATRSSLSAMMLAATGSNDLSEDQLVDTLAGPPQQTAVGRQVHQAIAARIRSVLDDQRLVSLDTLFGLYDGLHELAHGGSSDALIPLAESLREFEMPRPILTSSERIEWQPEIYTSRHAELQVKTDLTRIIRHPGSPAQVDGARGQLTPFLRDTLVGLNYAYYEPPGAEVLHHDPLFVRSHDFSARSVIGLGNVWGEPQLMGIGVNGGGGAYLIGSLAGLPYALASAEENFIPPAKVQALIWQDLVPSLMVDAVEPRWWGISAPEMHAAALYQRAGEEILKQAAGNAQMTADVVSILSERLSAKRLNVVEAALQHPADNSTLTAEMLPADLFYLAAACRQDHPDAAAGWGPANKELDGLVRTDPSETSVERLARDFGGPHPTLEQSEVRTLENVKPFPALAGAASRLFGESWDSNTLYWARVADEQGTPPEMLNVLVPALTQHMISNIFATDIEDQPALLRALQQTGDQYRKGQIRVRMAGTPVPPGNQGW